MVKKKTKKSVKKISKKVKQERELKTFLIVLGLILFFTIVTFWVINESRKFDYIGLEWQKEKFGDDFYIYTTQVDMEGAKNRPIMFKVNMRNNPRHNEVSIEETVSYIRGKPVYLSLDLESGVDQCGSIALISFGQVMSGLDFDLITGISDEKNAEDYSRPYVTCETNPQNTVLFLTKGNESSISKVEGYDNCYELSVGGDGKQECQMEIVKVIEKFETGTLAYFTGYEL